MVAEFFSLALNRKLESNVKSYHDYDWNSDSYLVTRFLLARRFSVLLDIWPKQLESRDMQIRLKWETFRPTKRQDWIRKKSDESSITGQWGTFWDLYCGPVYILIRCIRLSIPWSVFRLVGRSAARCLSSCSSYSSCSSCSYFSSCFSCSSCASWSSCSFCCCCSCCCCSCGLSFFRRRRTNSFSAFIADLVSVHS